MTSAFCEHNGHFLMCWQGQRMDRELYYMEKADGSY
jgi:hypothetical protein